MILQMREGEKMEKFGERKLGFNSLSDERLVMIDTLRPGFYDNVINYSSQDPRIQTFIKDIREVRATVIKPFYRPRIDPSIDGGKVVYKKGCVPAIGRSYMWWEKITETMTPVEGKKWKLGTKSHYNAFMVFLINALIDTGWSIRETMEEVVLDSKKLGNYFNVNNRIVCELTGSSEVAGICDVINTFKILHRFDAMRNGFWIAGGAYFYASNVCPVSQITRGFYVNRSIVGSVGWLIIE